MNLIKKLAYASLLGGAMLLSNPAKSALVESSSYNVKEVKTEVYDPKEKKLYPITIRDIDEDNIIDEVIIYGINGKNNWVSLRDEFNSKKSRKDINDFLGSFHIYSCSQKNCIKIGNQDVKKYQKMFRRGNIHFGD